MDCRDCVYYEFCLIRDKVLAKECPDFRTYLIWDCQDCKNYAACGCPAGPALNKCFELKSR